ncbi:MAG: hypothetical protein KA264_09285 [Crocinitomicaceae bacterium]|nr:hypothetical protein [Crocinitomicaceae bacterium]
MFFKDKLSKYYRKPDFNLNELISNDIIKYRSPDKKYKIVLSHFREPLNTVVISFFCLTDKFGRIIEKFDFLISLSMSAKIQWSLNSEYFTIPIYNNDSIGIYNVKENKISLIPVLDIYNIETKLDNSSIEFMYSDNYAINFEKSNDYPTKKIRIPKNIKIDLETLNWFCPSEFNKIMQFTKIQEKISFKLEYLEFNEYKGDFPTNTDIEIFKIERFAEYGHKQSIELINSLNQKNENYYNWEKISKYVG